MLIFTTMFRVKYQAVGRFVTNQELLQSHVPRVGYYPHRKIKTSMSTYA